MQEFLQFCVVFSIAVAIAAVPFGLYWTGQATALRYAREVRRYAMFEIE